MALFFSLSKLRGRFRRRPADLFVAWHGTNTELLYPDPYSRSLVGMLNMTTWSQRTTLLPRASPMKMNAQ